MEARGKLLHCGTVVATSIIEAPTSTKNRENKRDEQMHSTKKGTQWHFGMKTYTGMDAKRGMIHAVTDTATNVHDIAEAHKLIRKDDKII